jgi:hypothetical protein
MKCRDGRGEEMKGIRQGIEVTRLGREGKGTYREKEKN